jgi:hypothetical protein
MKMTREPIKSYHISYNLFFIFIFKKLIFFFEKKKRKNWWWLGPRGGQKSDTREGQKKEKFKLVTFTSYNMVHNRLNYPFKTFLE